VLTKHVGQILIIKKMNFSKSRTLKTLKELANFMLAEETGLVSNLCKRQFFIKINAFPIILREADKIIKK
jgi:hypothetical protein